MLGFEISKWDENNYFFARLKLSTSLGDRILVVKERNKEQYKKAISEAFNKLLSAP